jgi:hypothetical protein
MPEGHVHPMTFKEMSYTYSRAGHVPADLRLLDFASFADDGTCTTV